MVLGVRKCSSSFFRPLLPNELWDKLKEKKNIDQKAHKLQWLRVMSTIQIGFSLSSKKDKLGDVSDVIKKSKSD